MCKELIIDALKSKLENLRSIVIDDAEQRAITYYRVIYSRLKVITESSAKVFEEYEKITAERDKYSLELRTSTDDDNSKEILNKLRELNDRKSILGRELNNLDAQLYEYRRETKNCTKKYTEEQYVEAARLAAEKNFDNKIVDMADRLFKKGFTDIKITSVCSDFKLFDAIIESNGKKVHARSIVAAEESNLMKPHFRFIIT